MTKLTYEELEYRYADLQHAYERLEKEYIGLRNNFYSLIGTIGSEAELSTDKQASNLLDLSYRKLSSALDYFDEVGIKNKWINPETGEVIENV